MNNDKYISFKGVTITTFDTGILKGPFFLNDSIIEFYFRFLELTYGEEDILLVSPAISFWLANSADCEGVKQMTDSLKIHQKQLVLFTINDEGNQEKSNGGGLHWSLLVYYRDLNSFVHHDSVKGFNQPEARMLYMAVKDHVNRPRNNASTDSRDLSLTRPLTTLRGPKHKITKGKHKQGFQNHRRMSSSSAVDDRDDDNKVCMWEFTTPQQSNKYDCGLYVMKIAAVICEWYMSRNITGSYLWSRAVEDRVTQSYVQEDMRSDILELIEMLKEQGY